MRKLADIHYNGAIALEITNMGYEHIKKPDEFLAIAFDRAERLNNFSVNEYLY